MCICFWLIYGSLGLKVSVVGSLVKPVAASLMMGAVVYPLKNFNIFTAVIGGFISYVVILFVLGVFDSDDWKIMKEAVSFPASQSGGGR